MKIIKESSISYLDDVSLVDKLVEFIKSKPFPTDKDFHSFAEDNDIDPDKMEQYAYAMLSVILTGGVSKGKEVKASDENTNIGKQIETEHVKTGKDNKIIKHIEEVFVKKILSDHLAETDSYYVDGVDFKSELKQEKQCI